MKHIIITGTVGKDAELKTTQGGDQMAVFSVAVDDGYGENKSTMWFDVTVFGKRGVALAPHISKGSRVTAFGELGLREHNGKTYPFIRASEVSLQGSASSGPKYSPQDPNRPNQTVPEGHKRSAPAQSPAFEDEIPFMCGWR